MVATSLKQLCQICFHCVEIVLLVKPVILECFDAMFKTGNDWILTMSCDCRSSCQEENKLLAGKPKISLRI